MKKVKELLLFLAALILPIVLLLILPDILGDAFFDVPHFVSHTHYFLLFLLRDSRIAFNTWLMNMIASVIAVTVLAVILFFKDSDDKRYAPHS